MRFLVVGNITKDELITKAGRRAVLGGASYAAIAAAKLGWEARIVSRGNAELEALAEVLRREGIRVDLQPDDSLTHFLNDYSSGRRRQWLLSRTGPIAYDPSWDANVIHINPMFGEVGLEEVGRAKRRCELLSLDAQGFVRGLKGSMVVGKFWLGREAFLRNVDLLKVGRDEAGLVSRIKDPWGICRELSGFGPGVVELTLGARGSLIFAKDGSDPHEVPAYRTKEVDPTGAGDVYAAAFAIKYLESRDALEAGLFASAAASFAVEAFGTDGIAERGRVEERYRELRRAYEGLALGKRSLSGIRGI
ncbi:MAG: PfkB family carbohydrate kinase [Candidatus Bathyarchaeia archaeon]